MNEYRFCPYCGKPFDYSKQDIVDNYLCTHCGEIVVKSAKTIQEEVEQTERLREYYEERQHSSGMYVQQDLIDMYRRER